MYQHCVIKQTTFVDYYLIRFNLFRLNVVVFYDDAFAKEFGAKAQDEVKKIIKGTNDIFGHSSLTPKMQLNVDVIEQAKGNNWTGDDPNPYL